MYIYICFPWKNFKGTVKPKYKADAITVITNFSPICCLYNFLERTAFINWDSCSSCFKSCFSYVKSGFPNLSHTPFYLNYSCFRELLVPFIIWALSKDSVLKWGGGDTCLILRLKVVSLTMLRKLVNQSNYILDLLSTYIYGTVLKFVSQVWPKMYSLLWS